MSLYTPAFVFAVRAKRFLKRHHILVTEMLTYEEYEQQFYYTAYFEDLVVTIIFDRNGRNAITHLTKCIAYKVVEPSNVCLFNIEDKKVRHRNFRNMTIQQARQ